VEHEIWLIMRTLCAFSDKILQIDFLFFPVSCQKKKKWSKNFTFLFSNKTCFFEERRTTYLLDLYWLPSSLSQLEKHVYGCCSKEKISWQSMREIFEFSSPGKFLFDLSEKKENFIFSLLEYFDSLKRKPASLSVTGY
jgi:hypothetical protein